ncbi:MAG: branched-chain amino acid ABC transporter permease [Lachnospiraceae bacterium]|nr:branched-chain amino acid ABC transporter permease [Lachnospiraceae bacterium]
MKNKKLKNKITTFLIVIAAYAIVEILLLTGNMSSLLQGLLVPLCTYSLCAVGLNLCVGYLGELSLGHAGFMCIGAFTGAFFSVTTADVIQSDTVRFLLALVIGTACAALFGFLIAIPVLRLNGDYLAIVTLAFGEIIKNVINVLYVGKDSQGWHVSINSQAELGLEPGGVTYINGAQGITGTPHSSNFTIGVILVLIALFVVYNLTDSRTGRAIMSIRDNQIAAESVGINVKKYKLLGFTVSTAIAGTAGVLYAHNLSTLTALPKNFGYNMSIMILVFVVLGGIGNFRGSVIAACILTLLPELLRGLSDYRMLIYAVVLIAMMLFNWAPDAIFFREQIVAKFKKGGREV